MADYVRLAPCPRCSSRARVLDESAGMPLRGHCGECGELLEHPLAVEALDDDAIVLLGQRHAAPARLAVAYGD